MPEIRVKLTVFFEDPFWVGVYERVTGEKLEACKITFGSQPKDYEVYAFILRNWKTLRLSPPVNAEHVPELKINPKRMQRMIQKQVSATGVGTKAQEAMKLQREAMKEQRTEKSRKQKEEEKQVKFTLRKKKHKQKHKGR